MPEPERTGDQQVPAASDGRAEPPEAEPPEVGPAPEAGELGYTEAEAEEIEEQERRFTDEGGARG